ncbi:MAG: prolipoprotein diacylglyceryl transferase [Candidatus Omnitrophota bacterium]|nr:prolipoprotein diacylglyceryl transferase [Candidatus Omnitrophota bacterium]
MKPILWSLGNFEFRSYYVMMILGVIVVSVLALRRARHDGFPEIHQVIDGTLLIFFTGFVGARLLYIAHHADWFLSRPLHILAVRDGGLTLYGSLFLGGLSVILYARWRQMTVMKTLDFILPFMLLVYCFIRIGCFLNGCCYGTACDLPWALQFPESITPVHPTQLYEIASNLALFLFLYLYYPRKKYDGEITLYFFLFYPLSRFIIEFWRIDDHPDWQALTLNQVISVALLALTIFVLYPASRRLNKAAKKS